MYKVDPQHEYLSNDRISEAFVKVLPMKNRELFLSNLPTLISQDPDHINKYVFFYSPATTEDGR